ncbi:MAG: hypothetical protein MJ200_04935 [Mycoplasmoidaceae bacterium]|nr:hypothetical protein [Mycoplasmoidaceae bacterium]
MKKRNLLVPLATLVAAATPTIAITSCTMENSKPQTLNINKDGILLGFKKGTTKAKIKKQFGNTMMIPKEVTYIAPYAFVNVPKQETTIPDFIENFIFEEGYKCEEIGQMAFAYAPFKSVKIENERQEGIDPENPSINTFNWSRPFDKATGQYTG